MQTLTPTDNEHVLAMDAAYIDSRDTIATALERMESGQMSPDIAYTTCEKALADNIETTVEILGLDLDDVENHIDDAVEYIEAESDPSMGQALRALVDDAYDSVESGIMAIAVCAGVDEATAIDWYNDDDLPSPEQAQMLVQCFPDIQGNPQAIEHFMSLAMPQGASEEFSYARQALNSVRTELDAIKSERAEFSQQQDVQNRLRVIERDAKGLYDAGAITPFEYKQLAVQDLTAEDRPEFAAFFSAVAQERGYSTSGYLDCLEFHLQALKERGAIEPIGLSANFAFAAADAGDKFLDSYRSVYAYG